MPDPEEIQLIDDNDEANDPIAQLISAHGTKQEHDQQDFDDSNFDNTMDDTGNNFFMYFLFYKKFIYYIDVEAKKNYYYNY